MRAMGRTISVITGASLALAGVTAAAAMNFGPWSAAVSAESIPGTSVDLNTTALEGCPFVSQRGDTLYFASNRVGGQGGLDIWYSTRNASGAWGEPVNFAAVNTSANELCPMAHRNGRTFLFVRPGVCGGTDIYMTRRHETRGWAAPTNLGCTVNSAADEASPSLTDTELYFSSTRTGGLGGGDIYVSSFDGVSFGAPTLVAALSTGLNDFRPNLRRDGLEIFFDSNRPGGQGGLDLWTSTRASTADPWAPPTPLGSSVNSPLDDLRATLSWDGRTLYFGSTRALGEGSQDLYVITR
jgi:Tol biopolymer transport system component